MYLLWPYLRTYTATLTGLSIFPRLTIYTMNVPKPPVIPAPEDADDSGEAQDAEVPAADAEG
jgi:hypothetical protein